MYATWKKSLLKRTASWSWIMWRQPLTLAVSVSSRRQEVREWRWPHKGLCLRSTWRGKRSWRRDGHYGSVCSKEMLSMWVLGKKTNRSRETQVQGKCQNIIMLAINKYGTGTRRHLKGWWERWEIENKMVEENPKSVQEHSFWGLTQHPEV